MSVLAPEMERAAALQCVRVTGRVASVRGLTLLADDLPLGLGALVTVRGPGASGGAGGATGSGEGVPGEVIGFSREQAVVMLLGQPAGIRPGDRVVGEQSSPTVGVGKRLLGRVIDGLGRAVDGLGPVGELSERAVNPAPIAPMRRRRITRALATGVRCVDLMTTLGKGQRLGVFAGPGVGKSTLLGSIARRTSADVNVIALVGERGREVKDFIEHALGPEGLRRSVVVVATGDDSPLLQIRAAKVACAAAEHFRDAGLDVLLMMDSVTRFANAQRQVGLSAGEPPATKGYTPSVFAQMALLLERAGAVEAGPGPGDTGSSSGGGGGGGSITGLYTILVEGDDMTGPVADAARGILDGHVILSRKLAQKGHFPAVDVMDSVSRVADEVCDAEHAAARRTVARVLALHAEVEDLVQIGAYARGSSPETDVALEFTARVRALLRQGREEAPTFEQSRAALVALAREIEEARARAGVGGRAGAGPGAQGTGGQGAGGQGARGR